MSVCTVCPDFVGQSARVPILVADALYVFLQDNNHKIVLDDAGKMTQFYRESISELSEQERGMVEQWIITLFQTSYRSVEFVAYRGKARTRRAFSVGLSNTVVNGSNYILWSREDYKHTHLKKIKATVLDRDEAIRFFQNRESHRRPNVRSSLMVDLVTAGLAIKAISDAIGLVDKVSGAYTAFKTRNEVKTISESTPLVSNEVIVSNAAGTLLEHRIDGTPSKTVSREDLSNLLRDQDLRYIQAFEDRLNKLFDQWEIISKEYENAGVGEQAKLHGKLEEISAKMGVCVSAILDFTQKMGFAMSDHYSAIRTIAGIAN